MDRRGSSMNLPAPWVTAYDVDFTALSVAGPFADGNVVIDGKTWIAQNAANIDSGIFDVTAGTGLRVRPTIAPDFKETARSVPVLTAPLSALGSFPSDSHDVRVSVYRGSPKPASNWNHCGVAFEPTSMVNKTVGYPTTNPSAIYLPVMYSDTLKTSLTSFRAGSVECSRRCVAATEPIIGGDDLAMSLEIQGSSEGFRQSAVGQVGTYSGGWPTSFSRVGSILTGSSSTVDLTSVDSKTTSSGTNLTLVFASASAAPFTFVMKRLRIEYRKNFGIGAYLG